MLSVALCKHLSPSTDPLHFSDLRELQARNKSLQAKVNALESAVAADTGSDDGSDDVILLAEFRGDDRVCIGLH